MIIWIAHLTTARRVDERAQSMKAPTPSTHSPIAETRHCSALSWSAVSRNESRYRLCISSSKVLKKSVTIGSLVALSSTTRIGCSILHLFRFKPPIAPGLHRTNGFHLAQRWGTTAEWRHKAHLLMGCYG